MIYKFEAYVDQKLNTLYITEIMRTEFLQVLDVYWDEGDKSYSSMFDFGLNG